MMNTNPKNSTYRDAGVAIDKGNELVHSIKPLARATTRPGANTRLEGFAGFFDLKPSGFRDPVLVSSTDGVGTKLRIAIDLDQHDNIGIDLVAMCVNDLIVHGAEPLFFLDYYATGQLDPQKDTRILKGIAEGCLQAGCALIGGETAEMPGLYKNRDYDLAGFAVGAAEREDLLPLPDIKAGDVILGLASSGLHSNGFSLVRHIAGKQGLEWTREAPFSPGRTLGEELLRPTRIYVRSLLSTLRANTGIKGLAHITGGGLHENIPRILPKECSAVLDLAKIPPQPVFSWLAHSGNVEHDEMIRTFNCGIGMVLVVAAKKADQAQNILREKSETVVLLGEITKRSSCKSPVIYHGEVPL